jgi:chromosome segregation protein
LESGRGESSLAETRDRLAQLDAESASLAASLEPLRAARSAAERAIADLEEKLARRGREGHELESHYSQARIELGHIETQLDGLRERIQADLGLVSLVYDEDQVAQEPLPMADIVEELPEVDVLPDDIENTLQRFRGQLHRMGAINPAAPAEYEETRTRLEFLTQQLEDLTATQSQLQAVVQQLDRETSVAFAATVDKVNGVFGEVFRRLFGGGSAQLVLTDPDDLTLTGVEIVARLPNRREQGLGLLSGGERSLTAAALIFALLKVSPTPFCVLDEVDAMLDEANINRFRDLLVELSEQTQFIVITHNRGTVQVAEAVYGISMGGDSASQVISVRPEEYLAAPIE